MKIYKEYKRLLARAWKGFLSILFVIITTNSLAIAAQPQVAAGDYHTVGLKTDGTVVAVGGNDDGQLNVTTWTNIAQVAAGVYHTVGVKTDGTVVAVGNNDDGQLNVTTWRDIVQVAGGWYHTVGLKSNGRVEAVGWNEDGQLNVGSWTGIIQVAAGDYHTVGLRSDGTVVAVGWNEDGQLNVTTWTGIVQISAGFYHTVGLKSDGTVVAVGWNEDGQVNVSSWTDIVQVSAGGYHTVGLKSDGTVVAVGWNDDGQLNVNSWTNIAQVAAGGWHTVGLKADGTVVAVGWNDDGQGNTSGWNLGAASMGTGMQITGTASNITTKVQAGDTVHFTVNAIVMGDREVHYRFFTRAGYGEPDWGGNRWTIAQDYGPANSTMVTFDTPGTYFLVGHLEYPGETWAFGDPQSGIVVEVSGPLDTGIQIIGTSSNIMTNVIAGQPVTFAVDTIVQGGGAVHYRFFTRAGYGQPDWGGNRWTVVQDYGPANSVVVTFDTPGIYFLIGHIEYSGGTWEFGDPQSGIPIEVWPVQ